MCTGALWWISHPMEANWPAGYASSNFCTDVIMIERGCDLSQCYLSVTADNSSQILVNGGWYCFPSGFSGAHVTSCQISPHFWKWNILCFWPFMSPCHEKPSWCSHQLNRYCSITDIGLDISTDRFYLKITN